MDIWRCVTCGRIFEQLEPVTDRWGYERTAPCGHLVGRSRMVGEEQPFKAVIPL